MPRIEFPLITGADVPIKDFPFSMNQPTVAEIAEIGEQEFFQAMNIFFIDSKPFETFVEEVEFLNEKEKKEYMKTTTSFENLVFILKATQDHPEIDLMPFVKLAFYLMFPDCKLIFNSEAGIFFLTHQATQERALIDREEFLNIREVAKEVFLLDIFFDKRDTDNMSERAKEIAEKMAAAEAKINAQDNEGDNGSYFARILSVMGVYKDLDYLTSLTLYQLQNQFDRHSLYAQYEQSVQAIMAGATDVEIVDWYKNL